MNFRYNKVIYSILGASLIILITKLFIVDFWIREKGKSEIAAGRITQWKGMLLEDVGKWAFFYHGDSWESELIQKGIGNSKIKKERFFGIAFLGWQERYKSIEWLRMYTDTEPDLQKLKEAVRIGLEIKVPFKEKNYSEYSREYLEPAMSIIKSNSRGYEAVIRRKFQNSF